MSRGNPGEHEVNNFIIRRGTAPESEMSQTFVQGMADRMGVSYRKYGPISQAYPKDVDAIASLRQRLDCYEVDGNTEWLMDVANFAMIEFMRPRHPLAHYRPTDSGESPGRMRTDGRSAGQKHNLDVEIRG